MTSLTTAAVAMDGSRAPVPFPWPPKQQAPFPPWPEPQNYIRVLPYAPPNGPDLQFIRANFCGVRVPGVPLKPGMAGYTLVPQPLPALVMDLDIFKFYGDYSSQQTIFQAHQDRGLTHFQFSLGHAVEQGWSIQEVITLIQTWRLAYGGYADIWFLGGGPWATRDQDWAYWQPILQPWIAGLLNAGALDLYCVGWQLDQFNSPMGLLTIIRGLGAAIKSRRPSALAACHWVNEACAWWDDLTAQLTPPVANRFDFHRVLGDEGVLDRDYWQINTAAPAGPPPNAGYQGSCMDLLKALVGTQRVVLYESFAQAEFDDPTGNTEQMGNLRDYLGCCAGAYGYGNGGSTPSGGAL